MSKTKTFFMTLKKLSLVLAFFCIMSKEAAAVRPDEVLKDTTLEQRARLLSAQLRCLVCQNQSIDDSDAPLAKDLRVLLRERLQTGETDEQVMAFVQARYGEFILLKPRFSLQNAFLWLSPFFVLLMGAFILYQIHKSQQSMVSAGLSTMTDAEKAALESLSQSKDTPA